MDSETRISLEEFIKKVPHSRMVYPESLYDRFKYVFWRLYTPYHPLVRDTALILGIVEHRGRQDFVLGKVTPDLSVEEFINFVIGLGFKNHFIAWKDTDELVSLRYAKNFVYQYHLRVYKDGEVRGHYEYTPECRPIYHMREVGMEDRRDEFLKFLQGKIV